MITDQSSVIIRPRTQVSKLK